MGQYYKPVVLDAKKKKVIGWAYTHDYDNGLKLMEHSYIGNSFMNLIENQLIAGGAWYKQPIVWAGDYADPETSGKTLYSMCSDENKIPKPETIPSMGKYPYIVNHTTKQFVDKRKVPVTYTHIDGKGKKDEWRLHPLSILTCDGNGRGGGDFHKESDLVGAWARNIISIERRKPTGYTELTFDLVE